MTEDQIQQRISQLKSEILNLEEEKNQYDVMNKQINKVIPLLITARDNMYSASLEIKKNYKIDGKPGDGGKVSEVASTIDKKIKELRDTILANSIKKINSILSTITSKKNEVTRLQSKLTAMIKERETLETVSQNKGYYSKPSYNGGSIVDGLSSMGIDSSFSSRKKIAAANGISNYTSSYDQNVKLLGLLKSGELKK